jgi:hypothetical protein
MKAYHTQLIPLLDHGVRVLIYAGDAGAVPVPTSSCVCLKAVPV